ncbi:MAG: ABC transporter substrate-binding protein, partial [Pseudomonadota bacterium]
YQNKQLDFLRRVPSKLIPQLRKRADFFHVPMARFDYIGFGERLKKNRQLREALVKSINYGELKQILHSLGRPGCPSMPAAWFDQKPCYPYAPEEARKILGELARSERDQVFQLKVSQLGGNDIKKQAEFLQHQWQSKLGIKISITQVEQKTFLNELRRRPPDIFRKGVGLDIPTCLNGLETFVTDNRRNFAQVSNQRYEAVTEKMSLEADPIQYKKLCREAIEILMEDFSVIPLGEMHFSIMASEHFEGWKINSMNQLDLSQLRPR